MPFAWKSRFVVAKKIRGFCSKTCGAKQKQYVSLAYNVGHGRNLAKSIGKIVLLWGV